MWKPTFLPTCNFNGKLWDSINLYSISSPLPCTFFREASRTFKSLPCLNPLKLLINIRFPFRKFDLLLRSRRIINTHIFQLLPGWSSCSRLPLPNHVGQIHSFIHSLTCLFSWQAVLQSQLLRHWKDVLTCSDSVKRQMEVHDYTPRVRALEVDTEASGPSEKELGHTWVPSCLPALTPSDTVASSAGAQHSPGTK